jgi:hypothetical protein
MQRGIKSQGDQRLLKQSKPADFHSSSTFVLQTLALTKDELIQEFLRKNFLVQTRDMYEILKMSTFKTLSEGSSMLPILDFRKEFCCHAQSLGINVLRSFLKFIASTKL